MTSKDEALKMAIEYLEYEKEIWRGQGAIKGAEYYDKPINACKEALEHPLTRDWKETIDERIARDSEFKEALEQPEIGDAEIKQMLNDIEYYQKRIEALEQPAQEPVAWMLMGIEDQKPKLLTLQIIDNVEGTWTPLYTHPHQWQGLTDDEIRHCLYDLDTQDFLQFARAIEAKLKEKNYD